MSERRSERKASVKKGNKSSFYSKRQKARLRKRRIRFVCFLACLAACAALLCAAVVGIRLAMDILPLGLKKLKNVA